ncbi:hypothetical protein H9655_21640 [Cytobacillus sp. Sa5YUA1]|uniref:Conjugal transfer protein n=1 Tax=Cytobacillus stercorigallinarum TaxID=2762240 RepID=A0ABR8QVS5_9BACI|nr:energy-coupling factor transporter transmembrane component T [Cytobacillus stercorigallinarum]MBD7939650.1 hypothetical protein [Cytobacillus stercorigallinarum]
MSKKKIALIVITFFLLIPTLVSAETNEGKTSDGTISGTLFEKDYSELEDGSTANYYLDVSSKTAGEEEKNAAENFFDTAKSWVTGDAIKDGISGQFYEFINLVTNLIFEWNKMMTNTMIGFLNFAFETSVIDGWINVLDKMMTNLSGISGLRFTENGLFGSFIGLIVVSAGLVAVYQMIFKRAAFSSLDTILKTVLTLSLALVLFTNFAPFMKGMNNISNQLSQTLLTGSSNTITADNRTPEELREGVSNNLWDMFITKPYLIMQYGNENIDSIGVDRVNSLLEMPKGEDRQSYIEKNEIMENNNQMMTYDNVPNRFVFTFIYSPINAIVSIPIFALGLALIVFQVWFLLMAFLSPFVLVWAAFPGQFGVLKKYGVELAYPLVCKFIATVATLFIFTLGFLIYSMEATGISQYLIIVFMQFVMFCMLFLLRKRISNVFGAGNTFIGLRNDIDGLKNSITHLGTQVVSIGAAAATGGSSAAATAAAGEVLSSSLKKGTSEEVDEDDKEFVRNPNEPDGTKPFASIKDIPGMVQGSSQDQEQNQVDLRKKEFDGTKPFASIKDIEELPEESVSGDMSEGSHLRLVHNSSETRDLEEEIGSEEEQTDHFASNENRTFPLVSMYDYVDEADLSSVSGYGEASAATEQDQEEKSLENADSPINQSPIRFDGTKPFASIYDFQDEVEEELKQNQDFKEESPNVDGGDVSYRQGGESR